jgi:acyl-CoA thioester hydrolase
MPTAVIHFRYEFHNAQRELLHTAETKLAFVWSNSMRPCRPPQQLLALLRPHFSNQAFGKNQENS